MRGKVLPQIRSERGQASLMIGMMMLTFILFFAFVVNTGMLVNAKINLQNAADLAAYAGAATQARQLTQISYLNYEMRRQYKKFLFRYYVVGNMAQAGFPKAPGASQPHLWSPDGTANNDYGVPSVCVLFDNPAGGNDNYCQLQKLPKIIIPNSNPLDQINETLIEQLKAIETIRKNNCGAIGNANITLALLWLFNTDPDLSRLSQAPGQDDTMTKILTVTRAAAYGLGLVPREIILRQRIETLANYVNAPAVTGATRNAVEAFKQTTDPAAKERTIQAFLSAYYTLGEHTFDSSTISMDELLAPGGTDSSNVLALSDVKKDFDLWAVRFLAGGNEIINPNPNPQDCESRLYPLTVHNVPIGVSKDPKTLTYYAVRLKAQAKVMFSPFGDMELKAYAAARPFGSRIGPPLEAAQGQLGFSGQPNSSFVVSQVGQDLAGMIPNLPVVQDDTAAQGKGWDNEFVLGTMYSQFFGGSGGATSGTIPMSSFLAAFRAAMAPNPGEGRIYNIINDEGPDTMVRNFDSNRQASFWAPIAPPGKAQNVKTVLQEELTKIFQSPNSIGVSKTTAGQSQLRDSILADILNYVDALQQGKGEIVANGVVEGFNIAHLQDPFSDDTGAHLKLPATVTLTDPKEFKSSWVSVNDSAITENGRVGYSVKFVSFDSLVNKRLTTNGQDVPTNTTAFIDDEAQLDVTRLQH